MESLQDASADPSLTLPCFLFPTCSSVCWFLVTNSIVWAPFPIDDFDKDPWHHREGVQPRCSQPLCTFPSQGQCEEILLLRALRDPQRFTRHEKVGGPAVKHTSSSKSLQHCILQQQSGKARPCKPRLLCVWLKAEQLLLCTLQQAFRASRTREERQLFLSRTCVLHRFFFDSEFQR